MLSFSCCKGKVDGTRPAYRFGVHSELVFGVPVGGDFLVSVDGGKFKSRLCFETEVPIFLLHVAEHGLRVERFGNCRPILLGYLAVIA